MIYMLMLYFELQDKSPVYGKNRKIKYGSILTTNKQQTKYRDKENDPKLQILFLGIRQLKIQVKVFTVFLFIKVQNYYMGNKAVVCKDCDKQEYCQQCYGCSRCSPIKNCRVCLRQNPKNITIRIQYEEFKRIYNQGTITKIQGKASQGASKVPFVGKNLHHFFIQVQVYHSETNSTVICAIEGSWRSGRMEMKISRPKIDIRKAFKVYQITNKPFRNFYDHIRSKEHEQKYQCFGNNCYHVGLRLIQHLYPEIPKADYQEIVEYKDKVISRMWD